MKCPDCDREVRAGESCAACGKKVAVPGGLKVEYKDFKGAELLDIQMTGNRPPVPEKKNPEPLPQKATIRPGPAVPHRGKKPENKTLLIVLAAVITAFACYLLLRIFLWQ